LPEKSPLQVILDDIKVDALANCSGVFIGSNSTSGWNAITKTNSGFGSAAGCRVIKSVNIVVDQDLIDSPVIDHFES
jgi:hypothetical protein